MYRIKQLRTERGISQRELARLVNANQKTVNFWERGESEPSAGFIVALADVFECTADYILGREDDTGNVNVMRELAESEKKLLELHRRLTKPEQEQLIKFAEFILSQR